MTVDGIAWIAHEAGLPLLEEARGGAVHANAVALARIGPVADLAAGVASITGEACEAPELRRLLSEARAGARTSARLGHWTVLSLPPGPDRTRLLFLRRRAEPRADEELAAGIAHELSNALGGILGWAELALRRGVDDPDTADALGHIERSARTARATARHLLDAARGAPPPEEGVDVSRVVAELAELLGPVAEGAAVTLHVGVEPGLSASAHEAQLFTVVWNLVKNAIEASPEGGVVALDARRRRDRVRIEVADQGAGISQADRARIFDPYFTTKREGTGLGLALVRQAIEAVGGRIVVRSEPGQGARFAVELLAAGAPRGRVLERARPRQTSTKQSGVRAKTAPLDSRILIVEDDRGMRELMVTALELAGATVVAASDAAEARAAEGPFDLALLDFGLDVRGDQLLAELRRRGTVRRAALVSGASTPPHLAPGGEPDAWIRKPFDLDDLLEAVHRLGARPAVPSAREG